MVIEKNRGNNKNVCAHLNKDESCFSWIICASYSGQIDKLVKQKGISCRRKSIKHDFLKLKREEKLFL